MVFSFDQNLVGGNAPEFPDGLEWLNSEPLRLKELQKQGKIVLIDFWTYSCVNCIRTLPYITQWHKKYADKGLVIVGVHTPEFEFEKDPQNVKAALKKYGIKYPVVLDSDYKIWNLWGNNVWPRKFLVDTEGFVIYDHKGEGAYTQTEKVIQKALKGAADEVAEDAAAPQEGAVCYPATPETYLGSGRGRKGGIWDTVGDWEQEEEYIQHIKNTDDYTDHLWLDYKAFALNIVAGAVSGNARLKVELNGNPVPQNARGVDLFEENEETFLKAGEHRMYNVISSKDYHEGKLKLYAKSDDVRLFAFTFAGCAGSKI